MWGNKATSNLFKNRSSIFGSCWNTSEANDVTTLSSKAFNNTSSSMADPLPTLTILIPGLTNLIDSSLIKLTV
ncbi:hypothetical protein WICPIJ_009262 [Wickerhamomyces pijperi]|uniref:Uncharacterized protein n=1 Tax=Wickerhamomyces pijperi TaxID=599730 RepID=A0A9P8PR53_WICPI|nr:hypothetical protein WICPIJ_009262 [Wickerhamomyces pijperi]